MLFGGIQRSPTGFYEQFNAKNVLLKFSTNWEGNALEIVSEVYHSMLLPNNTPQWPSENMQRIFSIRQTGINVAKGVFVRFIKHNPKW